MQSAKFSAHCRVAPAGCRARHSAEFFAQCRPGRAPVRSRRRAGVTDSVTVTESVNQACAWGHSEIYGYASAARPPEISGGRAQHWRRSSADLFPGTGEALSQVFSSTGNNQPLGWHGLLKSEDTSCPKSGLAGAHDMPGSKTGSTAGRRGRALVAQFRAAPASRRGLNI